MAGQQLSSVQEHPVHTKIAGKSSRFGSLWQLSRSERDVLLLSTAIKLLLFPSYRSTDFEVHRNWLAITNSLPLSKWYFDTTSEWTLDYPPFFAYFEWLLSLPAAIIDSKIADLYNLNYDAWTVIAYQRTTVIASELLLGSAVLSWARSSIDLPAHRIIAISIFLHPGFLIVDHMHFQYNGYMFGIFLWSIVMARKGNKLMCGVIFAVLLNFKHIYMYLAPAYFVYLLRGYCMTPSGSFLPAKFIALGSAVMLPFALSLGPFMLLGQLPQVAARLFPFKRGLNHAYWAPNAWALVTAADRVLLQYLNFLGTTASVKSEGLKSSSRGLVGDTSFAVLPNVTPMHTFCITIALQSIFLFKLWSNTSFKSFVTALTLSAYASFLFGWHVHEKAVLLILLPLSLLAAENEAYFRTFVLASVSGIAGLFPLIFTPNENLCVVAFSALWAVLVFRSLCPRSLEPIKPMLISLLDRVERTYLWGFVLLQSIVTLWHPLAKWSEGRERPIGQNVYVVNGDTLIGETTAVTSSSSAYQFLPLMLVSVYSAVGLCWAFVRLTVLYLTQ